MMEPIVPPFTLRTGAGGAVMLDGPRLYDQGMMPALDATCAPPWIGCSRRAGRPRKPVMPAAAWRPARPTPAKAGLPADRKIVALPPPC